MSLNMSRRGADFLLRDGGIVHIRRVCLADQAALHEFVERVSDRSLYLRFFTAGTRTPHDYVRRMASAEWRGSALVALVQGEVAGLAESSPEPAGAGDGTAMDIGLLVDDRLQGRGIGTLLLEQLAVDTIGHGVTECTATILRENTQIIEILRHAGLPVRQRPFNRQIEVRLSLRRTATLAAAIQTREHAAEVASLSRVLCPRSVAVFADAQLSGSSGRRVLRGLIHGGYTGAIYPIGSRVGQVLGLPIHRSLRSIPGEVGLAVVATPAEAVIEVARECAEHGVQALLVISDDLGSPGGNPPHEQELRAICRRAGVRMVGPGSIGIINTRLDVNLDAGLLPRAVPARGRLGVTTQSAAVGEAIIELATLAGTGISSFVDIGDEVDVHSHELLHYWEDDEDTGVIALYLTSFGDPRRFAALARRVSERKAIVALTSGRSAASVASVAAGESSTVAVAPRDAALGALLRHAGVIQVDTVQALLDTTRILVGQPLPQGDRVAIVTNSEDLGSLTADACMTAGLDVPEPTGPLRRRFAQLGMSAEVSNPVDLTHDADADLFEATVRAVLPGVDAVIVVYASCFGSGALRTCARIAAAAHGCGKPVLACVLGEDGVIGADAAGGGAVPCYARPDQAAVALAHAVRYARWRARRATPEPEPEGLDPEAARALLDSELERDPAGHWLDPATAHRLAGTYGIRVGQHPVARGVEITIGAVEDPVAGPLLIVGTGGAAARDRAGDQALCTAPVDHGDVADMIRSLRCASMLLGRRGDAPVDIAALEDQIVRLGHLVTDFPEIIEFDLDPMIVTPQGADAVHVRAHLARPPASPSPLSRYLR
jgi:acyl-CoA synthetase (NDP forming)/GNAT superfamily N-acetyltransferase